jgi:WD40 repeat protein
MIYHGWFGATPLWIVDLTENTIRTIDAHSKSIYAVAISPDSQLFASASADGTVRLWESESLELVHEIPMPGGANDVQFSADGAELFIAGEDGTVRIWGVE